MAKFLLLSVIIAMAVMSSEGLLLKKLLNRRDPFPEPENPPTPSKNVVWGKITQQLDNFDPTNDATWTQRYLMNGEFFREGGVIFVFLGGEWTISPYRMEHSLMADMARELNGYMLYLEHRYYGESRPTKDVSDANLRFLTSEQALADVAHFVAHIKSNRVAPGLKDSPVVVIGGHYSGSLAVFFRQKYPHLTLGAWASGAPLLSVVDHYQYKEQSGAVYRQIGGARCYNALERGFAETERLLDNGLHDKVEEIFNLCGNIETEQDRQNFFATISALYSMLPQLDGVTTVDTLCGILTDNHESKAHALGEILGMLLEDDCASLDYETVVREERRTEWNDTAVRDGARQYSYQLCSQFVWYHSSNSRMQPFGNSFPVEFMYRACEDIFGPDFNEASINRNSVRLNTVYGGLNPSVTNTLFVHGELDPWRSVGVQKDLSATAEAIIIRGASQGKDLGPVSKDDSRAVADAKAKIQERIRNWIAAAGGNVPL